MVNWNNLKIIQTISEQHARKAINQGTAESSHIRQCIHTAESANVKVQNIFHGQNNKTCGTNCKYRTAATIYTVVFMVCFRYVIV
jgi:ureidoglycolate hydrolase